MMPPGRRIRRRALCFCSLLVAGALCSQANAQKEPEKKRAVLPAVPVVNLDERLFRFDHSASATRRRWESTLKLQIANVDRAGPLTQGQRKKLQLAGTGDIVEFFDRYEEAKQKFESIKDEQEKFRRAWEFLQPLVVTAESGPFGPDSLFYKSLHSTVTPDQLSRYDALVKESNEFRRRARIELAVLWLEEMAPLSDAQRQKLTNLLMSRVTPCRKPGFELTIIMVQLGKIPEETLKPLFDEMQWKAVNWHRSRFKGLEQWLKENNVWPEKNEPE
jgi:hypothetical protein